MVDRAEWRNLRYVTAHFEVLQGLAVLPLITWCALAMAWANGWVRGWVVLVAAVLAVPATVAAVAHYRRRYGQVRPHRDKTHDTFLLWPVVGLFTVVGFVDALGPQVPVSPQGLVLSVGALAGAWRERPLAPAFLVIGIAGAALSLTPLSGPSGTHPLSDTEGWIFASCAGAAVLAAWSHLLLRRTLGPVPAERS
ncbi:hypothetical protein [Micromonospora sp. URMC 103]|uniref:hypothetical protein n=1 Tax=Micromonospora sp. URMC 103 TaxID=3423406 RepID=UPI003F1DC955